VEQDVIKTPLKNQGYCNKNYLAIVDGKKFIIKEFINKNIDRDLEFKLQNLSHKRGIAPRALSIDNKEMMSEFIKGVHLKKLSRKNSKLLAKTLRKLHSIKARSKVMDLKKLLPYKDYNLIQKANHFRSDLTLTHNDLNFQNIIFSNKVMLIDFEYSMRGDIYFDLASVLIEFELDEEYFLRSYFKQNRYDLKKIKLYKQIYKEAVKEWFKKYERGEF
jgi:thiamine kinase-like enzyme